jgi:hypothetical protein
MHFQRIHKDFLKNASKKFHINIKLL